MTQTRKTHTKPRIITLLPSTERGGAEEHSLTISKFALNKDFDVHCAFTLNDSTSQLADDFKSAGITYHNITIGTPQPLCYRRTTQVATAAKTYIFLKKLKPDIALICLPTPFAGLGILVACAALNIPTITTFHLITQKHNIKNRQIKLYKWIKSKNQTWVSVSENNRKLIQDTFKLNKTDILLIRNGINIKKFNRNNAQKQSIRDRLLKGHNIPHNSNILITVGSLNDQKGHKYLIPTMPHILKKHPNTYWVWLGDGDKKTELQQMTQEYGVTPHVLFLGKRKDVADWLSAADIFILPSRFEGLPFAILEAMAAELPVITTSVSGIPEIIKHMHNGILCRKEDCCCLLMSTIYAIENKPHMKEIAQNAKNDVKNHTEDIMCSEFITEINNKLLNNK